MPEILLVFDKARIFPDAAIAQSVALGIGQTVHGMPPWAEERGLDYGPDGYLVIITCGVPEHAARREVLATLTGKAITMAAIAAVGDHPPDPPSQKQLDTLSLQTLALKPILTAADLATGIKLLIGLQ